MALTDTFAQGSTSTLNALKDIIEKGGEITSAAQLDELATISTAAQSSESTDAAFESKVSSEAFTKLGASL